MAIKIRSKRILVIKTRAIGDTVLLTGPLRVLKKHFPYHTIEVLVSSPGGHLLENLPYIDRVISVHTPKNSYEKFAYWMRLIRRLRNKKYEKVLNFHASLRTILFSKSMRTKAVIINDHNLHSKNRFTDIDVPGRGMVKSIIDRDLDILRAIGIHVDVKDAMPEIRTTDSEKEWAHSQLTGDDKYIYLGIGGSRETKRWPARHFIELAAKLRKKYNSKFVIAYHKDDERWMKEFSELLDQNPDLKNHTQIYSNLMIREVAALLSRCSLYIGNDSGVKHMAVAVGVSTFSFFGPELPNEWHPYDQDKHPYAFITGMDCRTQKGKHWCSIPKCVEFKHRCMTDITPESILFKLEPLLAEAKV